MRENDQTSFRDPQGSVLKYNKRIFRFISPKYDKEIRNIIFLDRLQNLINQNQIIPFEELTKEDINNLIEEKRFLKIYNKYKSNIILDHKVVNFPSFAYEWSNTMFYDAAKLTLNLFEKLLKDDIGLKDATPFNVLFEGSSPIFIDLLSFEKREVRNPIWLGYAQFVEMFLLPLLVSKYTKTSISEIFFSNPDGLKIDNCLKKVSLLSPLSYFLVFIPHCLSKFIKPSHYQSKNVKNPEFAKFVLSRLIKKAKKRLNSLKPESKASTWSGYMQTLNHYEKKDFQIKENFIKETLAKSYSKAVLDIGCNTGYFSEIAAKNEARVIAIDNDTEVIDKLYNRTKQNKLNILPLVVNICKTTPSMGWKNQEYLSFIDRATDHFDMVFMLAVIHHMQVSERVPIEEIANLAISLTKKSLIIEYIDPKDPMSIKIVRGREDLHRDIDIESFKKCFEKHFEIIDEKQINSTRSIVYIRKK